MTAAIVAGVAAGAISAAGSVAASSHAKKGAQRAAELSNNAQIAAAQINQQNYESGLQFQRDLLSLGSFLNAPGLEQQYERGEFSKQFLPLLANEFFDIPRDDQGRLPQNIRDFYSPRNTPPFTFAFDSNGQPILGARPGDPRLNRPALPDLPNKEQIEVIMKGPREFKNQDAQYAEYRKFGITPGMILYAVDSGVLLPGQISPNALATAGVSSGKGVVESLASLESAAGRPLNLSGVTLDQIRSVPGAQDQLAEFQRAGRSSPAVSAAFELNDNARAIYEQARFGGAAGDGSGGALGGGGGRQNPSFLDFAPYGRNALLSPLWRQTSREGLDILKRNFAVGGSPTSGAAAIASGRFVSGLSAQAREQRFNQLLTLAGLGTPTAATGTGLQQAAAALTPSLQATANANANLVANQGIIAGQAASVGANTSAQATQQSANTLASLLLFGAGGGFGSFGGASGAASFGGAGAAGLSPLV